MKRERERERESQQEAQAQRKVVIEILSDSDDDIDMQKGKGDKCKDAQREGGRTLEKTYASTVALIPPDETWDVLQVKHVPCFMKHEYKHNRYIELRALVSANRQGSLSHIICIYFTYTYVCR
jgi:hypothetical protein